MRRRPRPWRSILVWALVWIAGAQFATIAVLEWRYPDFLDPKYGCRMRALRSRLQLEPARPLFAVLGSSRAEQGFRPSVLVRSCDRSNPIFYNLARGGSSPLLYLLTLRRLLADGIRPEMVLVEIFPPALVDEDGGISISKPTLRDWPLLRRYSIGPRTWAFWLFDRLTLWHKYRSGLVAALAPDWLSPQARWGEHLWDYRGGEWRVIGNGIAPAERRRLTDDAHSRYFDSLQHFRVSPGPDRALRELLDLCKTKRIAVMLFLMPESRAFRAWYPAEARRRLTDYLLQLRKEHDVPLIDARRWIADGNFADGHHLLEGGAVCFTRWFAGTIVSAWHKPSRDRKGSEAWLAPLRSWLGF